MEKYEEIETLQKVEDRKVLLVTDKETGKHMVIKTIKVSQMNDRVKAETNNEVKALLKLQHRHIVSYITSIEDEAAKTISIVMPYCQGGDLYGWIEKHRNDHTSFVTADIVMVLRQLCEALAYCHSLHVIHRDIKPRNIFVENQWTVKLGDFGIAKILESTSQDAETHNKGTYRYSAPEIFGKKPYRHKCDIWSLGCVIYEMTTLEQPFNESHFVELTRKICQDPYPPLPKHVDRNLVDLIAELLDKDPHERPNAKQILAREFVQQPPSQTMSRTEVLQMMSMFCQMKQKMEELNSVFEGLNKKVGELSNEIKGMDRKFDMLETKVSSELNKNKSDILTYIEKEAQLIKDPPDGARMPSAYSFDFYIENFKDLVNSGKDVYSIPVYVQGIKSSVVGYAEFNDKSEMIVWLKFARHPREVGFPPAEGKSLQIKATIMDIHKKKLKAVVIGALPDVNWDENVITSNVDFGYQVGKVGCNELLNGGYGEGEGYSRGAILVRFDISLQHIDLKRIVPDLRHQGDRLNTSSRIVF